MLICVKIECCILLSFLAGGHASIADEDTIPSGFAERLEKLEMDLKYQKQENEYLKVALDSQKQQFERQIENLNQTIKALTKIEEEQTVTIKRLETEMDMLVINKGQESISVTPNVSTKEPAKVGLHQVVNKFRNRRLLLEDVPVGFTAYLDHNTAKLGINQIIPFNRVLFNEGNAYNNSSGIFVCPADGVYMFYFSVSNSAGNQIVAKLVVNGVNYVDAIADSEGGTHNTEAQGSNMAILALSKGSHVCVENYRWGQQQADGAPLNRFTSFSGIRLY